MNTADFLHALLAALPADCIIVSSLGRTSEELDRLAPDRTLFTDTMGDVASLSTGMAISAHPLPVAGIDTDGSFLMNLSVLTMLGSQLPQLDNHLLAIVDNERYESAGGLRSRQVQLDWQQLFAAVGLSSVIVHSPADVPARLPVPGTVFVAKVLNEQLAPDASKTVDGIESSYLIERRIAQWRGRPHRLPAVKA